MSTSLDFSVFLERTFAQKEVSLAIAANENQITAWRQIMQSQSFQEAANVFDLAEALEQGNKVYTIARKWPDKNLYDFMVQYPTGQIQLWQKDAMQSRTSAPVYQSSACVIIVLDDQLNKSPEMAASFLQAAGLTYRE